MAALHVQQKRALTIYGAVDFTTAVAAQSDMKYQIACSATKVHGSH
jgi:hypothetical protein